MGERSLPVTGGRCGPPLAGGGTDVAGQRKTGAKAGRAASKVLRGGQFSKTAKTAAGSALSQRAPKRGGKK